MTARCCGWVCRRTRSGSPGSSIRKLQLRGLAERVLVVAPSNLAFQWQRELQEKFDETFVVLKGSELRAQFGVNQGGWRSRKRASTLW